MTKLNRIALTALALALAAGAATAAQKVQGCPAPPHRIVMIDGELFHPSSSTMSRDDVLEFDNESSAAMRLVFTEPQDPTDKIHCRPLAPSDGNRTRLYAPLVAPGPTHHLTAIVPPGRPVSVCSFAPGRYTFIATPVTMNAQLSTDMLGTKGTIVVRDATACAQPGAEHPGS